MNSMRMTCSPELMHATSELIVDVVALNSSMSMTAWLSAANGRSVIVMWCFERVP